LAALVAPSSALGARGLEVSIMDDELLLGRSQAHIDSQMALFSRLGVDRVRVSAFWEGNAPEGASRPAGFDAANPDDPRYRWAALDRVVQSAAAHGLRVMLTITTPAPQWAAARGGLWRPSPAEFGAYGEAVGLRYGSLVDQYGIGNEPNQGGWLQPQSDRHGLISPHVYRALVQAAYPRIKRVDPGSVALIGNLASSGSRARGRRAPIRPLRFLREMACVDGRFRPVRSGPCRGFQPVPLDAIGHHPYSFFQPPARPLRNRDDAGIADGRRLLRTVDRLVRAGRLRPSGGRRVDLYYTEFAYQTNPPDPFAGISLARQSRWLQQAAYVAWRTPRVRGLNQFRLTDGAVQGRGVAAFREFQSGLLFRDRRPKPAYRAFPHPVVVAGGVMWGQVRPGGAHTVAVQRAVGGAGGGPRPRFRTVRRVATDASGYFRARLPRGGGGRWRFRWDDAGSGASDAVARR
jgi:hypothetical protein